MAFEILRNLLMQKEPVPNRWTEGMGELIRKARTEAGLSQLNLANKIYRRQTTLSDMERGKIEVDTTSLAMLADVLRKPVSYFFPWDMYKELTKEELDPLEEEALLHFREIRGTELQKLTIQLIKKMKEFDPEELVLGQHEYYEERRKRRKAVEELNEKRRKKK
jgi:transcriptional regulator with XRE-family HTH domain